MNTYHSILDPIAEVYDKWLFAKDPQRYVKQLDLMPAQAGCVLDAGCGSGELALGLAMRANLVIGLDFSLGLLERAQQKQQTRAIGNVIWLVGDVAQPPFANEQFDLVVCMNVLHNLPVERALTCLRALVMPSGRLIVRDQVARHSRMERLPTKPLWDAIRRSPNLIRLYGIRQTMHILATIFTPAASRRSLRPRLFQPALFRDILQGLLPGCVIQERDSQMLALWERPHKLT